MAIPVELVGVSTPFDLSDRKHASVVRGWMDGWLAQFFPVNDTYRTTPKASADVELLFKICNLTVLFCT